MLRTGKDTFTAHYKLPTLVLTLSQGLAYLDSIDWEIYGLSNTRTIKKPNKKMTASLEHFINNMKILVFNIKWSGLIFEP